MSTDPTSLLQRLVAIPSVHPDDEDAPEWAGELRMAEFLEGWLRERGFRVERRGADTARPNVVARFGPSSPRRRLMIEAHMDTVSVRRMTRPPFDPVLEAGRIYGRGASDTKGPMAAALASMTPQRLHALEKAGVELMFVAARGEEKGNEGALELAAEGVGADEAVILEPTEAAVVHAHKGAYWLTVHLEGRSGHGSAPHEAQSAVLAMIEFLRGLQQDTDRLAGTLTSSSLGPPTLNVGRIEGGQGVNIVPGWCSAQLDRRTLPGEDPSALREDLEARIGHLVGRGLIRSGSVEVMKYAPPFETPADSPAVRRLLHACGEEGVEPRCEGSAWYSDAGPFSQTCGDVLVFGPGSICQAHTPDEYIDQASLETGTRVLGRFLDALAAEYRDPEEAE